MNLRQSFFLTALAMLIAQAPTVAWAQLVDAPKVTIPDEVWPADWYAGSDEELKELRALEGKPAQELSVAQWRGDSTTLAQLKGKIVVIDFWATWCGPCMAAIPKNIEFIDQYKDKGVALIGIHDAKSGWDDVDKVISEKGINYPVALDQTEGDEGVMTKAYAVKFWPTYFVLDRDGIVRAAAIKHEKLNEVVDRLLSESPAPAVSMIAATTTSHPDVWFLGGDKRLKSLRDQEGKKASKLAAAAWVGKEPDASDWRGQVRVVQFVRPEIHASVEQLSKVQAVADRFTRQGVVFVAICDARSSREKMQSIVEDKHIEVPVAIDSQAADSASSPGATAQALGIKFAPTTVVIDRAGKVRAAGLKPDFLDKVLNGLLAEATSIESETEDVPELVTVSESKVTSSTVQYAQRPDDGQPPSP